jgi:hypothetical protein
MAQEAERPEIIKIALATPLGNRDDMIRLPQAAAAGDALHPIETKARLTRRTSGTFERREGSQGVDAADGAASVIAGEDLVAQISRVGTKTPLVHTVVAAEGAATSEENFKLTPSAERKAVRACGKVLSASPATRKCARRKHD